MLMILWENFLVLFCEIVFYHGKIPFSYSAKRSIIILFRDAMAAQSSETYTSAADSTYSAETYVYTADTMRRMQAYVSPADTMRRMQVYVSLADAAHMTETYVSAVNNRCRRDARNSISSSHK